VRRRRALTNHRRGLAEFLEAHEIGFPVAGEEAIVSLSGSCPGASEAAATGLEAGQETMPVILPGRAKVEEAVDGLVTDESWAF